MEYFDILNIFPLSICFLLGVVLLLTVARLRATRKEVTEIREELVAVFRDLHRAEATRDIAKAKLSTIDQTLRSHQDATAALADPRIKRLSKTNLKRIQRQDHFNNADTRLKVVQADIQRFVYGMTV